MHTIRIWDLPTRLFHWLLALSVMGLIATGTVAEIRANPQVRQSYLGEEA